MYLTDPHQYSPYSFHRLNKYLDAARIPQTIPTCPNRNNNYVRPIIYQLLVSYL